LTEILKSTKPSLLFGASEKIHNAFKRVQIHLLTAEKKEGEKTT